MAVEVHKVSVYFSKENETIEYTAQEFIEIPPAQKVLFTIGENKIIYLDKEGNELPVGKSIVFLGKLRRAYMKEQGQAY